MSLKTRNNSENHKLLVYLIIFMVVFFGWSAYEAAENAEAAWKSHDARMAAAMRAAE